MAEDLSPEELARVAEEGRRLLAEAQSDPVVLLEQLWQMLWRWGYFEIFILSPTIDVISPPIVIKPELLPDGNGYEFVYPIHDYGYRLVASKAEDMYSAGMSNCKLFYTIRKNGLFADRAFENRGHQ